MCIRKFASMNSQITGPRIGMRHVQTFLLFFGIVAAYMSRLNISVALVAMTNAASTNPNFQEFDWTEKQKSYIISSFYWGYVVTQFPGGYLSRRFGSKIVMFMCILGSAMCSVLTPFLVTWGGWQIFCAIRTVQGLCQAALFPSLHQHVAKWSPPHERNMLGALTYSGVDCGTVMAMLLSGLIAGSSIGWPGISYISAGICFIWCLLWLILAADNPPSSRFITKMECQYIEMSLKRDEDFHEKKIPIPWLAMFTSVSFLALLMARCAETWGFSTIQTQIPSYLNGVLNMNIKSNALYSALPYIARWIMSYVYLFCGNMAVAKGWLTLTAIRKIANTGAFWVPAFLLIGIGFLDDSSKALAIVLMTLNVGFNGGATTGCLLTMIDMSPNHAGVVMGIMNPLANVIPLITPLVVGVIVTDTHNRSEWQIVFIIAAAVFFFGNLIFIIFGTAETQPWDAPDYLLKDNIEEPVKVAPKSTFKEIFGYDDSEQKVADWAVENFAAVEPNINEKENKSETTNEGEMNSVQNEKI
ncbi:putative inorganic phosphate cotransporter isoform X1 [Anastrepha ludens]|uniref:putative inorganic phosphate cotransporter isoform X1 n=2 Tax=Anastrepha ludens TaxID=28586 RepID=UPI0023B105D1|nr:putative inorganic phosphate cotransporter isoform X1 [Anastrepha ludens]